MWRGLTVCCKRLYMKKTCFVKGQVIRATFSHNLSRNIVALQVEKGCCPYYHRRSQLVTQQISMLQVAAQPRPQGSLLSCAGKIGSRPLGTRLVAALKENHALRWVNSVFLWQQTKWLVDLFFSFCTSLVNAVLRLCSCFLRQLSDMLNFWHNSSRALDLRGLFLYSSPQVSYRHGCFSSSLHKSFLWASDNLQHRNLLRNKSSARVVIRATTLFNLQRNNVARQVVRKCCPYYLTLTTSMFR